MSKQNEIQLQDACHVPASVTPMELVQQAAVSGASVEVMERLLDMQLRWEANEARKAFHAALAAFKANPPHIVKDRHVRYEKQNGRVTEYNHASLSNVTDTISSALSKHGLSASWKTEQDAQQVRVTCTISHVLGHSESTSLSSAPDTSDSKNSIQAIGSAVTYLQRYTLLALTGLATHEQDDDGLASGAGLPITPEVAANIKRQIEELDLNESAIRKFLGILKADSVDTITNGMLGKAESLLAATRQRRAEK